ncbi:MAG: class I SAM-dependent methyltransferase [Bryobacteraceae bacterium]
MFRTRAGRPARFGCAAWPPSIKFRTVIDAQPVSQPVILGAGSDTRAWRLEGLHETAVVELDHPAIQPIKCAPARRLKPAKSASRPSISGTAIWPPYWRRRATIPGSHFLVMGRRRHVPGAPAGSR